MPRPRSSTFYLPLAPVDAPLSLKAKLSVLPPQAANALLAPRGLPPSCSQEASLSTTASCSSSAVTTSAASTTTTSGISLTGLNCHTPPVEDECARLERVLGLTNNGTRRTTRRHTDAPLPLPFSGTLPPPRPLAPLLPSSSSPPTPALTESSSTESIPELDDDEMELDQPSGSSNYFSSNPTPATTRKPLSSSGSLRVPNPSTDSPTPNETASAPESQPQAHQAQHQSAPSLFSEHASSDLGAPSTSRQDGERMDIEQDIGSQMIADLRTAEAQTVVVSSFDMDSFADACTSTPSTSTSSCSSSTFGFPSHTHRPSSSSINVTPPSTPRTPLSRIPCGIASVLACRAKVPSSLCSSFTLETEDNNSSRHDPLSQVYDVLMSKSLHPLDMRHLLPRHFRQTYPPPPPPPYIAMPLPPVPEEQQQSMVVAFVDSSIPGLVEECPMVEDVEELTESDSSSTPTAVSAPVTRPTLPPRQRFRLAPLYIHKVLRRTLGTTAWARAETLSYARVAERRYGFSLCNRDDPFAGPGGLENGLLSCGPGGAGASLVWGGYEDAFGMLSSFGISSGADNALGGSCGWDLDLEDEGDDEEGDFEEEDLEAVDMEQDLQQEQELVIEEEMPFIREGAPEPEDRPLAVIQLDVPSKEEDEPRPRSPSGYGGYSMVGRFTWDKGWSPVSPGVESGWPTSSASSIISTSASTSTLSTPVSSSSPEDGETRETFWDMDEDEKPGGPPATPYQTSSSTSAYQAPLSSTTSTSLYLKTSAPRLRRDDGEEEEEEIFRYSPLQIDDGWNAMDHDHHHHLSIEDHDHIQDGCSCMAYLDPPSPSSPNYLHPSSPGSMSGPPISPPAPISPSFPPAPLVGTKISSGCSSSEDEISEEEYEDVEMVPQHFTPPPTAQLPTGRSQRTKAPRPLALVQQSPMYYPAYVDDSTSPATGVFVIPPSPLNHSTFGQHQQQQQQQHGSGPTTPTASSHSVPAPPPPAAAPQSAPVYVHERPTPMEIHERLVSSKKSYERIGSRQSIERIESRRSFERIEPTRRSVELPERRTADGEPVVVAPRPQRASRALENIFGMESPKIHAGALPQSTTNTTATTMSNPTSPSTSASAASTGRAAWTFGSLKNALSNSVSHLVELARSRSPSPLPWLMRSSSTVTSTTATLAGAAAALNNTPSSSQTTPRAHEDIEFERASCVTPTPMDRSRRSSTSTIKRASASGVHVPQLNLQTVANSTNDNQSSSPPPKRTLSTSSLSSLSSEPDSESGSSGGMFSRSPSPEPSSDARIWDPSYSLTPRSRPISADAKNGASVTAATTHGGRLSPMVIPGSWDPEELWSDDVGVSKW